MSSFLSELFSKPRDRDDFLIALLVIALFGVFILYYAWPQEVQKVKIPIALVESEIVDEHLAKIAAGEKRPSPRRIIIDTDLEAEESTPTTFLPKKINNAQPPAPIEQKDERIEEAPAAITIETEIFEDAVHDTLIEEVLEERENISEAATIYTPDPIEKEEEYLAETEVIEESIPDETTEITAEVVEKPETKDEDVDCLIIVGAFKIVENSDVLIEQLKTAGYNSKKVENRGFTCVGVPVDCLDQASISSIMGTIKTKFKVEPWVMRN